MRSILTALLFFMLLSPAAGQSLSDDLVVNKTAILARYLPMHNGNLLYSFYQLPFAEVKEKLRAFEKAIEEVIMGEADDSLQTLGRKDVGYYIKNVLNTYRKDYGADSLGLIAFQKVLSSLKPDSLSTTALVAAHQAAYTKTLTAQESSELMEAIFGNPELDNEALYRRSAAYRRWLSDYIVHVGNTKYRSGKRPDTTEASMRNLNVVTAEIPSGYVKDALRYKYTVEVLQLSRDSVTKENAYAAFMAASRIETHRQSVDTVYARFRRMNSRAESPGFRFEDLNGKFVSLQSLRGRYVYIDVWATWCGPCKMQIPHLQQLEADFAGKNIHFVSLSVDRISNKKNWESYVREKNLGGIQLIADNDFQSDFIQQYNIKSIPRFILIDPEGRIVSGDALRPSDPMLRHVLAKLLE